jgi:iron complex outermembrane receptor protein
MFTFLILLQVNASAWRLTKLTLKMKILISLIAGLLSTMLSMAQSNTIDVRLQDSSTKEKIVGATVFYNEKRAISNKEGVVSIIVSDTAALQIAIKHIAFEPFLHTVPVSVLRNNPTIQLQSSLLMLEDVLVSVDERPSYSQRQFDAETALRNDPKNIGDVFKDKSGFGLVKRGGYAMDPVFRSFKYEQLNLIYDGGVYISGACPNRMDPASVQISPAEIDRIELVKGPFSVRYGQTMGALINIITNKNKAVDKFTINGEVTGGYEVNGNGRSGRASISGTGTKFDFSLLGGTMSFDDYKNGDGLTVPSGFSTSNYAVKLGVNPWKNHRLQLSWRQSFGKDIQHAALPMDSPKDNSSVFSLDYGVRNLSNSLMSLNFKAFYTYVDHLMTNENRPNFMAVDARSPVNATTYGGRIELGLQTGSKHFAFIGADLRTVGKDGVRNRLVKMMNGNQLDPPKSFTDLIWQDSWLYDMGIFAESNVLVNEKLDLVFGGRIDFIKSGADNPAPDFEQTYADLSPQSEVNFNVTASANHYFGQNGLAQLSLGRGQRAANLVERYINHFNVGMDVYEYVGNPFLKAEVNYQADFTVRNVSGRLHWLVNVFYSKMNNFISAVVDESLPRKFMPGAEPRYAKRFVNIDDSWQTGFDAELTYKLTEAFLANVGGYFTHAQNVDFDEPLAEIPPLTGLAAIRYEKQGVRVEFAGRFVAKQARVAPSFDESETPGFNVFDFTITYKPLKNLNTSLALRNIFDANYYEHLSRPYKNQSEGGMFYEPGRSLRVGIGYKF